ncbi:hypothetical protein BJY52DRAFT_1226571 [Lactarius psammicola]|nr:hypothetical protein BJY52DRAFT_1226571 [Lactarius psammicola]
MSAAPERQLQQHITFEVCATNAFYDDLLPAHILTLVAIYTGTHTVFNKQQKVQLLWEFQICHSAAIFQRMTRTGSQAGSTLQQRERVEFIQRIPKTLEAHRHPRATLKRREAIENKVLLRNRRRRQSIVVPFRPTPTFPVETAGPHRQRRRSRGPDREEGLASQNMARVGGGDLVKATEDDRFGMFQVLAITGLLNQGMPG